jgi:hypothetical protein
MRLFVRKLTSRHRRKVGLPDERSSLLCTQSLQLDRVSGQACAHLGQSCNIRARNHARRWPPGPKFRQARLPPLLHDVLALSHPVRGCEPHQLRLHLACHGRQAVHQWRAYLASFSLPTVHTTHASYGADTLAASFQHRLVLVCGVCCSLCVSPLFLPFGSSFKCSKSGKTRQMRPKSRNFLWRCAAGKKDIAGLSAERKKGHFSVKKCDLGSW